MMYAGVLRRGDGFYPLNAIMQNFVILCIIWQGIDWLRQRRFVRGALAAAAPILWPFCIVALLTLFPKIQDAPIGSAVLAWVITAPLPLWTSITDGGLSYLLGGIVLYALYSHRRLRLVVWAAVTFCFEFGTVYLQLHGTPDFALSQMFTTYYEWFSVFAVAASWHFTTANAAAGTNCCFTGFIPRTSTFCTQHPVLSTRSHSEGFLWPTFWRSMMTATCVPY